MNVQIHVKNNIEFNLDTKYPIMLYQTFLIHGHNNGITEITAITKVNGSTGYFPILIM